MATEQRFAARNGRIEIIGGPPLEIPLICVENAKPHIREHAEVFRGTDERNRKISIKVWKDWKKNPASFELAIERTRNDLKNLAAIKNQRWFGCVHDFDALPDPQQPGKRIPYIISEFIEGVRADEWLRNNDELTARCALWQSIYTLLSTLYSEGFTHGDPHLGNIMVLEEKAVGKNEDTLCELSTSSLPIKLFDFGSNLKWPDLDKPDSLKREVGIVSGVFFDNVFFDNNKSIRLIDRHKLDWRTLESNPKASLEAMNQLLREHLNY